MPLAQLLFTVLVSAAGLVASGAVSEFAKGAGKTAFDALKTRLTTNYGVKSLPLLEDAAQNPAFEAAIKTELDKPAIASDPEVLRLAETLRQLIAALPAETQTRYAVNIEEIRSGGALLFDAVEGVKAKSATSATDMTFKNVNAPPGKTLVGRLESEIRVVAEGDANRLPQPRMPQPCRAAPATPEPLAPASAPAPAENRSPADRPQTWPTRISLAWPNLMSKGRSSRFYFHVYPRTISKQAEGQIKSLLSSHNLMEDNADSARHIGERITVALHCPVITFKPEQITLRIDDKLSKVAFVGIPKDESKAGVHAGLVLVTDAATNDAQESLEFDLIVTDYIFDHVSRPLISRVSSVLLGLVSAVSFTLTFLQEIDVTLGVTAGTGAASLTAIILAWGLLPFRRTQMVEGTIAV